MKSRIRVLDAAGKQILSTLTAVDTRAFESGAAGVHVLPGGKVRLGRLKSPNGEVLLASGDPDLIKSGRVFQSFIETVAASVSYLRSEISAAEERAAAKSRRLVHNLTSLNGHMIQELYSVISQDRLAGNIRRNIPILAGEMRGNRADDFAKCFLSLAKHSAAMKNEFSVFKKIDAVEANIDKRMHSVHKVLMNVAYLFFSDFANKGSYVEIAESQLKAAIDYECAFVALYHLLDNASKYVCPNANVNVRIENCEQGVQLAFEMCSLTIEAEDIPFLIQEGVSGSVPKKLGLSGDGFGLSLVKRVMELHGGSFAISVDPGSAFSRGGVDYQRNAFVLTFPLS